MAGATTLDGAAEIVGEENEIAGGEVNTAGPVATTCRKMGLDCTLECYSSVNVIRMPILYTVHVCVYGNL